MSQLHVNILKLLQEKKNVKISITKARKLRDALRKLHEDTTGCGQESSSCFEIPLQHQQQETSSLTNAPVPHFLEIVTRYILDNHATQEGLLRKNGNERRANNLKDLIERNGAQIPPGDFSAHDLTCVLKRWFRCLPEPVIPRLLHDVFAKCVELETSHHHRTQALLLSCLLLPAFHLNTLKHVAVFLQEIAKYDSCNKMTSANLAKVLAPSLMPRCVKNETDPEVAKKFSDLSTVAVQVLIDNAPLIGILPPEYEALREAKGKDFASEDDLSDHEGADRQPKKKLFTFLKSKGISGNRASVLRTPQLQSRRLVVSKMVPQSCPPKMTKALVKKNTPPPHKLNEIKRDVNVSVVLRNLDQPFTSPPLQNENENDAPTEPVRVTRANSRRQTTGTQKPLVSKRSTSGFIVEERKPVVRKDSRRLHRSNASIRSLPSHSSQVMTRQQRNRSSVRRAATVRAAMKYSCATKTLVKEPVVPRGSPTTKKRLNLSPGIRSSPRKPPRLSRQLDVTGLKLAVAAPAHEPVVVVGAPVEKEIGIETQNDHSEPMEMSVSPKTTKQPANADEVIDSIRQLSVEHESPKATVVRRSSSKRSQKDESYAGAIKNQRVSETSLNNDGDDFVLRTVHDRLGSQTSLKSGHSSMTSSADNSGTCVDSDEDEGNDFVDGELFMSRLSDPKLQHDKGSRVSFLSGMLVETPSRRDRKSPQGRESVIAIRTNRAGFVRQNVLELENTFATPVGPAVRTRRHNTPIPPTEARLKVAQESTTPISNQPALCRNTLNRRPLTPANAKRVVSAKSLKKTAVIASGSETIDI